MKVLNFQFLGAILLVSVATAADEWAANFDNGLSALIKEMKNLDNSMYSLGRQMMLQQFFTEEKIRSDGQSGMKAVRLRQTGTKSYHADSHAGSSQFAIHDHSNNIRTVGLGESIVVINGVEFRTRHNDYRLFQPSTTSTEYKKTQPIPFPEVPSSVLAKTDVKHQIDEMTEYFRAFRNQNKTHRDYTPYFKPVLCYMEGMYTKNEDVSASGTDSTRHFTDAASWHDLQEKARFASFTGGKSRQENLPFLPTSIMGFVNDSIPIFAQWNYRVLCHPLKKELPTNRLRYTDDLSSRLKLKASVYQAENSRAARFLVNPRDSDDFKDVRMSRGLLDDLMEEIPGLNNYQGNLEDKNLDSSTVEWDGKTPKDVSKYHRWFKVTSKDAFGLNSVHRGFSDDFMFAAKTTQEKIMGVTLKYRCGWKPNPPSDKWKYTCPPPTEEKWTWAIPLEVIYLSPLYKWNPYKLKHHASGGVAMGGSRSGSCNKAAEALDGVDDNNFYMTPAEFYEDQTNAVCTSKGDGTVVRTRASGTHIFLPKIPSVGSIRMRYPIASVHAASSTAWKEKDALTELVMNPEMFKKFSSKNSAEDVSEFIELELGDSNKPGQPIHRHKVVLTKEEAISMKHGEQLVKITEQEQGHDHTILLYYDGATETFTYKTCDGNWMCGCKHPKQLIAVK